ncbi:MAG: ribosome biogenesis GTP-binding protein YihA/YsxC [Pyramidobacter sp.]|nr:ribosome biogenesis GTP-binding protein YihA/YsxC [Pyramidobacter sp.]
MPSWRAALKCTAFTPQQFPPVNLPEIALAGRSNVGKSSLINKLIQQKLAHVSATPGKTRSVNFFDVTAPHPFTLVDLPGFGHAARSKDEKGGWASLIERYITRRESLVLVVHLVDIRHGLLAKDRELQQWLKDIDMPVLTCFTKADKIARTKRKPLVMEYVKQGLYSWTIPPACSVSEPETIEAVKEQIDLYLSQIQDEIN